jgi:30S ribosomal protein S31
VDILVRSRIPDQPRNEERSMGKGDTRTRRGKIYNGSYGKKRPGKPKKSENAAQPGVAPARAGKVR